MSLTTISMMRTDQTLSGQSVVSLSESDPTWPPEPHALDCDWRFSAETASSLIKLLRETGPILSVGAPTVARLLEANFVEVVLVDRQPLQGVRHHIAVEATSFIAERQFRTAIVDPPWYPAELVEWSATAAINVGVGGRVFVSAWPQHTRPNASEQLTACLDRISGWAQITRDIATLLYDLPHFERIATTTSPSNPLSFSPRIGELIQLDIHSRPPLLQTPNRGAKEWDRFTLNNYQLAVRRHRNYGTPGITAIPNASGWIWPFVSMRAPERDSIDIWSSDGEVAALGSPDETINSLRRAFRSSNVHEFEIALASTPELLSWRIPRPPYRRMVEWLHQQ